MIDEREGQQQGDGAERPGGEELADHRLRSAVIGRVSSSSMVPSRRSSAQSRMVMRGHQQQEQPGDEGEERVEVGLAAIEEAAEVEGQRARSTRKMTMNTEATGVAK